MVDRLKVSIMFNVPPGEIEPEVELTVNQEGSVDVIFQAKVPFPVLVITRVWGGGF